MTIEWIDTILGLIGGFFITLISFLIHQKLTRKAERVENLRKHIRKFFPILKELGDDLSYVISIRLRSDSSVIESKNLTEKISEKLILFEQTFSKFRSNGLEPELDSSDSKLLNELKGLFIMWKMDNRKVLSNNIDTYHSKVIVCQNLVENYLKK